jgi:DNA-binding response OmpR family regulator
VEASEPAMIRVLLVQENPLFCEKIVDYVRSSLNNEVECARTGTIGAEMIAHGRFDIALISATLPDNAGIELARLASNENIAVLMLSENASISQKMERLRYRYLQKPFTVDALLSETCQIVRENQETLAKTRSCAARVEANMEALRLEIAQANRLFDAILARLGFWKKPQD